MKTLTFKMDVELSDTEYIEEGTVVNIHHGWQRLNSDTKEGSTRIVYKGEVVEYMNSSFVEF